MLASVSCDDASEAFWPPWPPSRCPVPPARASVEAPAIVKDVFAGPSGSITELGPPGLPPRPFAPAAVGGTFFFRATTGRAGSSCGAATGPRPAPSW